MEFNVSNFFAMRVGRQRGRSKIDPPMARCSVLHTTKYVGLNITSDLKWNSHIKKVTSKANSLLGREGTSG